MSNVISFLEKVGRDAELRSASKADIAVALTRSDIDAEALSAVLDDDRVRLERLLGARTNLVCGVFPGKDEPDEQDAPVPEEDEKPTPAESRGLASVG